MNKKFITKDSGKRQDYNSGMRRDFQIGKPRYDLITSIKQKYGESLLDRWAALMSRGAEKYGERNWELANSLEEFKRFKASANRHFIQAIEGEEDEDHFAAVCFNLNAMLMLMNKLGIKANEEKNR